MSDINRPRSIVQALDQIAADHAASRRPSTPPPATTMTILAADLLAMRVQTVLTTVPNLGNFPEILALKSALETYAAVRAGGAIQAAIEVIDDEPSTLRSQPHIAIDQVPGVDQ